MNNDATEPQDDNLSPSQNTTVPNQGGLPDALGKTIKVPEDQINAGSRASLPHDDDATDFKEEN